MCWGGQLMSRPLAVAVAERSNSARTLEEK